MKIGRCSIISNEIHNNSTSKIETSTGNHNIEQLLYLCLDLTLTQGLTEKSFCTKCLETSCLKLFWLFFVLVFWRLPHLFFYSCIIKYSNLKRLIRNGQSSGALVLQCKIYKFVFTCKNSLRDPYLARCKDTFLSHYKRLWFSSWI